ncbi:MAG: hypothetical protein E6R03_14120 [Hyphomicrobiaceae bacterium]|nr:MAG: hypothetical protein E6R03_14120 [Hyphomicrobiaceae bacterium]
MLLATTKRFSTLHYAGTRTEGKSNGRSFELVTLTSGTFPEVYVEYADVPGLMEFKGYANEIPSNLYSELRYAIETHCCSHYEWYGLD